jgi:hypothetical protein
MVRFEVNLFPNSGHHYYFVPLFLEEDNTPANRKLFEAAYEQTLPDLDGGSLLNIRKRITLQAMEWRPAKGDLLRWLRYAYGTRSFPTKETSGGKFVTNVAYGVWLAIETNVGSRERGFIWDVRERVSPDDPDYNAWRQTPAHERPTPYVASDPLHLDAEFPAVPLHTVCNMREAIGAAPEIELVIYWERSNVPPVPVHLVVDFGNSRTIALGLEKAPGFASLNALKQVCRPILFGSGLHDARWTDFFNPDSGIVSDSWFILREPTFWAAPFTPAQTSEENYEEGERVETKIVKKPFPFKDVVEKRRVVIPTRSIRRVPQMFVELSPTVIGAEAMKILGDADIDRLGTSFLSSPKRYMWDTDPVTKLEGSPEWTMQPGTGRSSNTREQTLSGDLMLFFDPDSGQRDAISRSDAREAWPPLDAAASEEQPLRMLSAAEHSRADSLTWAALAVIERAMRQINSEAWRKGNNETIRRELKSITVTFPPGWTHAERKAYSVAWRYARHIFYWSRQPYWLGPDDAPEPPVVKLVPDEAVASQLPILFGDIYHLSQRGGEWIKLFGRERNGSRCVRVMTIDIGGGTTDTAIVEYSDLDGRRTTGAHLRPRILFSDSSSMAGDKLVHQLIEHVLLPSLGRSCKTRDERDRFDRALKADIDHKVTARHQRSILTRSVFVPMVVRWLEDCQSDVRDNRMGAAKQASKPIDCSRDRGLIEKQISAFNTLLAAHKVDVKLDAHQPFTVDYARVEANVREWSTVIADVNARYVAAFDCDLVVVSGKPSELETLRQVLKDRLPIEDHRLVFAQGYHAGSWCPGTNEKNRIEDAKMVTVTGAALYKAMEVGGIVSGWKIEFDKVENRPEPAPNYWGRYTSGQVLPGAFRADDIYLRPDENDRNGINIGDGDMIGRARFLQVAPEVVYKFRWRRERFSDDFFPPMAQIHIRRVTVTEDGENLATEHLELAGIEGELSDGRAVELDDVELKLQTLPSDGAHWLDSGKFEIHWEG